MPLLKSEELPQPIDFLINFCVSAADVATNNPKRIIKYLVNGVDTIF